MFRVLLAAIIIGESLAIGGASASDLRLFTVGAGEVGGGYYAAASAICERVNRTHRGKLRCSPEATPGSFYNLSALRDGQLDFALVQSDWQRFALEGVGPFAKTGPFTDLRSVMSLYPESITVLARRGAGITEPGDLLGKRVDIGQPASGRRATVLSLIAALSAKPEDFAALLELSTGDAIDELCAGRIDATILILGHPNDSTGRALRDCGATLIPVNGPVVTKALGNSSDYSATTIPVSAYPSLTADIPTFAVTATVVTRAGADVDEVASLVSETLKSLPAFRITTPILSGLVPKAMQARGLTAPLHDGAKAAFASANR